MTHVQSEDDFLAFLGMKHTDETVAGLEAAPVVPICGVYFLMSEGHVVYVGKSVNIYGRIGGHWFEKRIEFDQCFYVRCASDVLDALEQAMIYRFQPEYNRRGRSKDAA